MKHPIALLAASAALALSAVPLQAQAAMTALITPPFSWGAYGGGLGPSRISVGSFLTPDGAPGGVIQTVDTPIYAAVGDPADHDPSSLCTGGVRCEQIGVLEFQYALWTGSQQSRTVNRVGAALMGGFKLTDPADTNSAFSFLQIYHDYYDPAGAIDGGVAYGKFNSLIPRWSSNPAGAGWNYGANAYQYQFWDVPFDVVNVSPRETVTFETALVNYDPSGGAVNVLADFNWSFSTATGALTGQQIRFNTAASPSLLSLYGGAFAGTRYTSGILSPLPAPEPSTWALMALGVGLVGGALRRRRVAPEAGAAAA